MHTTWFVGPLARAWSTRSPDDLLPILSSPGPLPVPPAGDRSAWTGLDTATFRSIADRASADLGAPWPVPLAHEYARYHRDGDRDGYEQVVLARQRRLTRSVVMAAATLDGRWLDEVLDGATLLCEQSSWCWPAHDDTRARHGAVVPTVDDPYLDLGAGEVVGQLAWLDHVLGEQLDTHAPGLRTRLRTEAWRRVVDPFLRRRDWHWLGLDGDVHNWSPWIHGNVLVAALQLVEDPRARAEVVALVVEGLDRYVAALPADGAIDEGWSYWWNGACRAIEALDLLRHVTGGRLDATGIPALRATVAFPARMHLGGDWYLNVADGQARPSREQAWHALHRAARQTGDATAQAHAASYRVPGEPVADESQGLGRLLRALTDASWIEAGPESPPLVRDTWLASTQVLVARSVDGTSAGLTLAAKGGHNGEHHNHDDVGSVVVALGGVPVLVDAGRPTYTAETFGPDRRGIWTMQSAWHCTPQVRGSQQGAGAQFTARDVVADLSEDAAQLHLDLAPAYPRDDVHRWWRTARLDRSSYRPTVTITDEWELAPDPDATSSVVHLLLAGDVTAVPGGVRVVALDGAGILDIAWHPPVEATFTERPLVDPLLAHVWGARLTRASIPVAGDAGRLVVTAREAT
jgi:hypothetical protein